ncbi:MAG TPA: DUF4351 domain-containing protein [Steroidobacter sp.]
MANGGETIVPKGAQIASVALSALVTIDADRAKLYFDLVLSSLSETNLLALQNMPSFQNKYVSHFANLYIAEGQVQGRVAMIQRQLTARFGALSEEVRERLESSSIEELDTIGDRLLAAMSLQAVLTPRKD